jgi:hypothetical protein
MLIEWARRSRAPLLANALAAVSRRISVLRRRVEALLSPPAAEPEREGRWSLIGVAVTAVVLSLFTWRPDVGLLIESSVASRVDRLDRSEMQTPQPTRAFPSQVAATPIVSPYLISLQPNVSVELLGVADRQANVQWWSPDGEPLDCLPSESQFISMGDGREAIVLWHDSEPPAKVDAATSRLAADVSQGLFRIGHTEGQWINRHVVDMIAGFDCGGMEVSWCDEADDICVSVGGSKRDEAVRVVAIDQCGVLHEAAVIDRFDGEITVSFKNLPFDLVDELIVQTRPLHWVEVPNVALAPTGDESV